MSFYEIDKIHPWLYRINDPMDVCFYLLVGSDKALLFDTGFGIDNIVETIKTITSKPFIVVLGHGHIDHACGAYQFDEVYLHENDFELCREHTSEMFRASIIHDLEKIHKKPPESFDAESYLKAGTGNLKKLIIDTVFDLGDLHVKVIGMPGHTKGSVGLLVLEKKVLLTSDSANEHVWMFLKESTSVAKYIEMLETVWTQDFDTFFTAHSNKPHPKSDFQKYIKVAREASIEKAVPYNNMRELKPYIYEDDGAAIVFSEETLLKK
ncbi:MAG: MBL fold metallo-hydrolase [Oscillospiraceae bacterium]|nr:MBL fold metallo-hydrolase [Oscillospiraceae bacterium]